MWTSHPEHEQAPGSGMPHSNVLFNSVCKGRIGLGTMGICGVKPLGKINYFVLLKEVKGVRAKL